MGPIFMALLLVGGWGLFAWSARRRWKLMMVGAAESRSDRVADRLRATWKYAILQVRMRRYPLAGLAHMLIFMGFVILLPRSLVLWGRGFDPGFDLWVLGHDNPVGLAYALLKDIFAVLVICGTLVFVYFRVVKRLSRLTLSREGLLILGIILAMMLGDLLYDGATIAHSRVAAQATPGVGFVWSEPAGSLVAKALVGTSSGALNALAHVGFWVHSSLVLIFLNLLPYSKHFHVITGVPNVYLQRLNPAPLPPIHDIEGKLEREETLGIRRINQFSWKAILDFYTCTECGRCSDHCPATKTGKKLSPKHFTLDLRDFLYANEKQLVGAKRNGASHAVHPASAADRGPESLGGPQGEFGAVDGQMDPFGDLVPKVIEPEVLWACTTCRACEQECPVFISYVDKIVDMRRYLVQEKGEFAGELQEAFRGLETNANPWNFPATDRGSWAEGLDIKLLAEHPEVPVLFWVGCMPSYDERAKKVTRATAKLMKRAGVDFAILGQEETCTGDPARRAGNEFLFQMFAKQNTEVLNNYGANKKTIVTTCPHCFNTLLNEYPDFGGRFNVVHHTTFLAQLVRQGKLTPTKPVQKRIVFHDSCYLGRYNEVYDDPRDALRAIPGVTVLEPLETRDRGMCCGAGGAQMFKEEEHGSERVNDRRTTQLLATNPEAVSSACPFCQRMLTDGLANKGREDVGQYDVAEILLESVEVEEPVHA
jgi:Fe-S oxidoreductase/nitrate reductase gamma subunit